MIDLALRNGRFATPGGMIEGDLGIEAGCIVDVGAVSGAAREEIDLRGRAVLPGAVDPHVHFRTPGHTEKEDFGSGSRAALAGGVTSVVDMPNTEPPTTDLERLREKAALAAASCLCHYGFWVGATAENAADLERLEASEEDFCGIKVYMGSSTGRLLVDDPAAIEEVFRRTRRVVAVHAESEAVLRRAGAPYARSTDPAVHGLARPEEAAVLAVSLVLELSRRYDHPAHVCHLSTARELDLVLDDEGHREGRVSFEVCPHHLAFDDARARTCGSYAKMNPPLRRAGDREALWSALARGDVDMIATDHAPHLRSEKERPYFEAPSGVPGVETSLRYLLREAPRRGVDLVRLAELVATRAADRFGLAGKGRIEAGFDADLAVLSDAPPRPFRREEVLSRAGWNPFEGETLAPPPDLVLLLGRVVAREGRVDPGGARGRPLRFRAFEG